MKKCTLVFCTVAIVFASSCKKFPICPTCGHGHTPPPRTPTLCDSLPTATGLAYVEQVHEFGLHEFLLQVSYTWPAPPLSNNNHAEFSLVINDKDYYDDEITTYGDSTNLAVTTFSTAIPDTTFKNNMRTVHIIGHYTNNTTCATDFVTTITIPLSDTREARSK